MKAVPFTDRELKRAWRELTNAATPPTSSSRLNPHRLLLFYAVECGLKAVWLKRKCLNVFGEEEITRMGHDLKQILKELNVGANFTLPQSLILSTINRKGNQEPRNGDISILHQAWRYGGTCHNPTDNTCEAQLESILNWIQGELK